MKIMILLSAFIGGGFRRNKMGDIYQNRADVFVINDKSRKNAIRVVSVYELFEQIIYNYEDGITINLENSHQWKNQWVGNSILDPKQANARISYLLAQVHQKKITASIGFTTMQAALKNI